MKNILLLALGVIIVSTGCSTLNKSDSAALQGTWIGQEQGLRTEGTCRLRISGNALEFRGVSEKEWYRGTFTLRDDTTPKQLIGAITECPFPEYVGKSVHAIYRLQGGTLTLTAYEPGTPEAPPSFDATGSRKFVLNKQ